MSTTSGACLVCGHGKTEHTTVAGRCTGTEGMCQCHGYNPEEHPAARLAARKAQERADTGATPTATA